MSIPLCDLEAEHRPLRAELEAAARRVLASGAFVLGAEVAAFEREVAEQMRVEHAVGVSSGTDALLALLMAAGIKPGDEVITTPFTFFATVGSIVRLGARPVFADVEPDTLNLDPAAAIERRGPRTRAILPVHIFGRPARVAPLVAACMESNVVVVEDAAQAMGAPILSAGSAGAALSFHPAKNLGGFGDGGMVLTRDAATAARVRALRVHGASEKFHHTVVGGNFRLDEIQAALLRVKLPHLPGWNRARARRADLYREGLADVDVVLPPPDASSVWNRFVIRVAGGRRDRVAAHLEKEGIATAIYYPLPLHLQPALAEFGGRAGQLPNAERACAEVLALPMHPTLSDRALVRICEAVRRGLGS
jgi:dTDP-4-amino-4,6-dideoxygalactose transaminase